MFKKLLVIYKLFIVEIKQCINVSKPSQVVSLTKTIQKNARNSRALFSER
jgi:hypothetical protein